VDVDNLWHSSMKVNIFIDLIGRRKEIVRRVSYKDHTKMEE